MKAPWAPFPYYLAQAQTGYIAAPSMLNSPDGGTSNPIGTGPFVFQDWVPNSHMTATRNPALLAQGLPLPELHHLQADHQRQLARRRARDGRDRHDAHQPPDNLLQFRGNKKYSYYDNSGQIVGQPTVQCIMLNT